MPHRLATTQILREEFADVAMLDEVHGLFSTGHIDEGMAELLPALQARRLELSDRAWDEFARLCLEHPLRQLLHEDPFTYRAFAKPRGYAGDAPLLDYIYGEEEGWPAPEASEMGKNIFASTTCSSACEAVRARRGFIADLLDRIVNEVPHPHILSIAAGHLREAHLCAAVKRRKFGRYVALDSDQDSLAEVQRSYGRFGVEPVTASIRQLLTHRVELGQFDFVYATGLFDYLPLAAAQRLTGTMFQMLRPGGRLLVANFLPGILDVGYMESFMDWKLIYRNRGDMIRLADDIPQQQIRDIRIVAEENQNIIFLLVTKADERNHLNGCHKRLNGPHFALKKHNTEDAN
ncbi:MAG TPA: class I SAM-dependent methyltransferase [Gemmataceae bacterium]|nr:class I SAM-dependent methyltransferase [Gemmataceae bacterium]